LKPDSPDQPADRKEIVRRYIEAAVNRGELDAIDRWLSPDCRNPLSPAPGAGAAGYKRSVAATRAAFPDVEVTFDYMVVEGWGTYDWLAVLEQLGATVAVPGADAPRTS
jgi:hypothetical protein